MITLQVNKFIGTLTNLIAYTEFKNTHQDGLTRDIIDLGRDYDVPNGSGKVVRVVGMPEVRELNPKSSTLLSVVEPDVSEVYLPITRYKYIQLSINNYLMRGAFNNEIAMNDLISYILLTMRKRKDIEIYREYIFSLSGVDVVDSQLTDHVGDITYKNGFNASSDQQGVTIKVPFYDTSTIKDPEKIESYNRLNSQNLYKKILEVMGYLQLPHVPDYVTGTNDIQMYDSDSLVMLMPYNIGNSLTVDALATLLNSSKITEALKWYKTITIPDIEINTNAEEKSYTSVIIMHKDKIKYGYFYQVDTAFFDASTLNTNHWLHFAYYIGAIPQLPCIALQIVPTAVTA